MFSDRESRIRCCAGNKLEQFHLEQLNMEKLGHVRIFDTACDRHSNETETLETCYQIKKHAKMG